MNWNLKDIEELHKAGKIRGYNIQKAKGYSSDKNIPRPRNRSKGLEWLELNLQAWCNAHSLTLQKEYQFDKERKWRSDFCIEAIRCLIEFEGGIFMRRSGHNSHAGIQRDIDKYQRAQELGWRVVRVTAKDYQVAISKIEKLMEC